jgi:chromosome segregation ATPase
MRKNIFYYFFLLIIFILSQPILAAEAQNVSIGSSQLSKEGVMFYQQGNMNLALQSFQKALMVDPGNDQAREYMTKMGIPADLQLQANPLQSASVLRQEVRGYKHKVADLHKENQQQIIRCDTLQSHNNTLCQELEMAKGKIDLLSITLNLTQEANKEELESQEKKVKKYQELAEDEQAKSGLYQRMVRRHTGILDNTQKAVAHRDRMLSDLGEDMKLARYESLDDMHRFHQVLLENKMDYEEDLQSMNRRLKMKEEASSIKEEVSESEVQILNDKLARRERHIAELQDRLLEKDVEIKKQGKMLAFAPNESPDLTDHSVKIIKAKDAYIADLKDKLAKAVYAINSLERNLGPKSIQPQKDMTVSLSQELDQMRGELQEKEDVLKSRDSDFNILQQRLSDAQQRLSMVEDMITEKDNQIKALESEVTQIRQRCVQ